MKCKHEAHKKRS